MRKPTAVIDLDITQPLTFPREPVHGTDAAVLWRSRQRPLGLVRAPVEQGRLVLEHAIRELLEKLTVPCGVALAERAIACGRPPRWLDAGVLTQSWLLPLTSGPTITVVIGAGRRGANLQRCVDAVRAIEYQSIEPLVVENTADAAIRRRAIQRCATDIVAFVDDDADLGRQWVSSIVRPFLTDPEVMVVTGPVIGREVAEPSRLFDAFPAADGFRRRWSRRRIDLAIVPGNVAFWRSAIDDPSNVVTWVFEPSAIVRGMHGHTGDVSRSHSIPSGSETVRRVDLAEPVRPITDATAFDRLHVDVSWSGVALGRVSIDHRRARVSGAWLTDVIAQELTVPVLDAHTGLGGTVMWSTVTSTLAHALMAAIESSRRERRRSFSAAA